MDELTPPQPPPPSPSPSASGSGQSAPGASPPPIAAVDANRGVAWWSEGWRLFTGAPGAWLAITVLYLVIMVMLAFVPVLGSLATTLLAPVFAGGVLAGCRVADRGGQLTIAHLFAGFADRLWPLMIVGLLYLAGTLAIAVVVGALLFAAVGMTGVAALLTGDPLQAGLAAFAALGIGAVLALLLGMLLGIPLLMAFWFAPALVALRNDEPVAAAKASFDACLRNMLPMLVYSLLGLAFAIGASIPFFLGWFVLAPVFAGGFYASYKDIFETGAEMGSV
jgi:uncharacterized membrane protein